MAIDALDGKVVRAIDVGYGNVKYTVRHDDLISDVLCELFPSRSPIASEKGLTAGLIKGRDTVTIKVRGTEYEVGRDVDKAQGTFDESAILEKDFCLTAPYLARLRGALYYMLGRDKVARQYMESDRIDLLVVGLPVSNYRNKDLPSKLRDILTGRHELANGRSVDVARVLVLPQPLGAFFEYAFDNGMFEHMREQNSLIIDPGFFTFDWLMSSGMSPIDARSDSVNRGMSAVLKAMAEDGKKKYDWTAETSMLVRMLEAHFRLGHPFMVYGKEYDVNEFVQAGRGVVDEAVNALASNIGDGADIQNIILAGGGATLYKDAIKEKFPRHNVLVMKNPVFSNVRGFQLAGEQQVISQNRKARQASPVPA